MPTSRQFATRIACLLALLSAGLSACSVDTSVSLTASTPARVQNLYVTVNEIWLNTSATAAAGDPGWVGSALANPLSVDLSHLNDGSVQTLISGVKAPAGTYKQLRLVLADSSSALSAAAKSAGLSANAEVRYLDSSANTVSLPLELPSPASELIVPASVTLSSPLSAQFSTSSSSAGTTGPAATIALDLDATRNLILFSYGTQAGALLSPKGSVFDSTKVGGISGTVDVSAVPSGTLTGPQGILVTAETQSRDGSRYEAVKSVSLPNSGAFILYPLPVADTGTTTYDLVIHGPGVRTVIITKVPVSAGDASTATPVEAGVIGLPSAKHYAVNAAANSASLPGGSRAGFYQTMPGDSVPHLIEYAAIDPFTGGFDSNVSLSADAIDFGGYSSGGNVTFRTSTPGEGIGVYRIASEAPLRTASSLTTTISPPTVAPGAVQPIFLPAIGADANALTLSGTLNLTRPGRFDSGFLLVSSGGQLIDVRDLSGALGTAATTLSISVPGLPGSAAIPFYDVAVRLWNSSDPSGTLTRAALPAPVDLSKGILSGLTLTVR
jgi:hypothetical protein